MAGQLQHSHNPEGGARTRIDVESAQVAALREREERRRASSSRRRIAVLGLVSALVLLMAVVVPEGLLRQSSSVASPSDLIERVMTNVRNIAAVLADTHTGGNYALVIVRYVAAFLTGAVLGSCGAIYQGAFRNPLASPSTIGVVSGCLLGAVVFNLLLNDAWTQRALNSASTVLGMFDGMSSLDVFWVIYGRAICAIIGGLAVVGTALAVARVLGGGFASGIVLVVVGQVFTLVVDSAVDTLRYYYESTDDIVRATLVQLAEEAPFSMLLNFTDLLLVSIPLVAGLVVLLLLRNRMNALSFTDDEARALGVDVGRFRTVIVALCTVLTGITVGFCGPIGFVGFVAPHVARRLVGSNFRVLLPASLLTGSIFLIIALLLVNQIDINAAQGVNLITTGLGCTVFLVVAFKSRGGARAWS